MITGLVLITLILVYFFGFTSEGARMLLSLSGVSSGFWGTPYNVADMRKVGEGEVAQVGDKYILEMEYRNDFPIIVPGLNDKDYLDPSTVINNIKAMFDRDYQLALWIAKMGVSSVLYFSPVYVYVEIESKQIDSLTWDWVEHRVRVHVVVESAESSGGGAGGTMLKTVRSSFAPLTPLIKEPLSTAGAIVAIVMAIVSLIKAALILTAVWLITSLLGTTPFGLGGIFMFIIVILGMYIFVKVKPWEWFGKKKK